MKSISSLLVIQSGLLLAFRVPRATGESPPESSEPKFTVCSVANEPDRYNNAPIKVRARVLSDGTHGAMIYDESCGDFGIGLDVPDWAKGRDELEAALSKGYRGTRDKAVYGTFTGTFKLKPGDRPPRVMTVHRIESATVELEG